MRLPWLSENEKFAVGGIIVWLGFALYFGWALSAQASIFDTEWVKTSPAITNRHYTVSANVDAACRHRAPDSGPIQGCALRDYAMGVCFIFLPEHAPRWLIEHENKHCDGYDHP